MNPFKKLAGQTAIYGIPTIVGRLLNYLLVPLYTYNFTTSDFGIYTELYAYVSFLLIILTYGMETALFNFSRLEENKEKVFSTILISVGISSLVFVAFTFLFSQNIADLIRYPEQPEYIRWFGLILGADAISAIAFAKLREQQKATRFAIIRSINIATNILFNVFFIVICPSVLGKPDHLLHGIVELCYNPAIGVGYAFVSNLIASLFALLLLLPGMLHFKMQFDRALWKRAIKYALPLLLAGLAGMTNETFDRAILKYLLPADIANSELGIYGACYKISIIMTIFIQTFRYAAEPFFFSNADKGNSRNMYAEVMRYFVIICSFIFLGTLLNLSWIQYFVGESFRSGLHVVPILLLANLFLGIFFNLSIWYKLTNQTMMGAWLMLIGAAVTIIGNFVFIPTYGYTASAWTTLASYMLMVIVSYFLGNKHFPVDYKLPAILAYLSISVLLYLVLDQISKGSENDNLLMNNIVLLGFIGITLNIEIKRFKKLRPLATHDDQNNQ